MFSTLFSLYFLLLTISIIILQSNSTNEKYITCSSTLFSCGQHISNIGYPFWGDVRPQYCGLPSLQLFCVKSEREGDYPLLKIGQEEDAPLYVANITMSHLNTILKLKWLRDIPCISCMHDITEAFNLSQSVLRNITLQYDCTNGTVLSDIARPVQCLAKSTLYKCHYLYNNLSMKILNEYPSCHEAEVPVSRKKLDLYHEGRIGSLIDVLKEGFVVSYEYSLECIKCRNSNGICGSSRNFGFVCHCEDGVHGRVCTRPNSGYLKLIHVIVISGGILGMIFLGIALHCYLKHRRPPVLKSREIPTNCTASIVEPSFSLHPYGVPVFSYSELQEATNNFDSARELGDGGYSIVYYGKLKDGREVAVKRLYERSYKHVEEFMNEVEILTRLDHPNLVILYGCTSRRIREHLLVYEYVSNGTLSDHLHGDQSKSKTLTWEIRMNIAIQTASALSYLHHSDVIHRDVKTNNILLNDNFAVKLADFGLSRLFPDNVTHLSTAPQGTPGYLDPEYHRCYHLTSKSDVYSFGVVLYELISSLPAVDINRDEDEYNLSDYAINRMKTGAVCDLVDEKLGYNSNFKIKRMIILVAEIAFQCVQQEKRVRPSMAMVLETLKRIEGIDYEALEAKEMDDERSSVAIDDDNEPPPRSPDSY